MNSKNKGAIAIADAEKWRQKWRRQAIRQKIKQSKQMLGNGNGWRRLAEGNSHGAALGCIFWCASGGGGTIS